MKQVQIDEINFVSVRPSDTLIGFANLRVLGWLDLNSIGVHKIPPSGRVSITFPSRKLQNNLTKFYWYITDPSIKEQIRLAIEKYLDDSGLYSEENNI